MGTPEFPNLGKHCSVEDCKQIDFLPFTCDRCTLVFCLDHRSYGKHRCPKANKQDVTVVVCPLCAKGVRLIPDEDPNITWETHVNTDCDPSNYERVAKKKKCPVPRCKELLTFSNTIKCRDCVVDHCLKHRFGPDHNCSGPKKLQIGLGFPFTSFLKRSQKEETKPSAPNWATSFVNAASSSMSKLSVATNQAFQMAKDGVGSSSSDSMEICPRCPMKFNSVKDLVEHVENVHERGGNNKPKVTIDACPKCSRGFHDPVKLVEHVEKDHGGTSKP